MENKIDLSNIIVIVWWAFNWKSLISLKLASELKYSWVISTDYIRNFLRLISNDSFMNVSTSDMTEEIFEKQREIISIFLFDYIKKFSDRKEKIILEWAHFSKEFLFFLKENWAKCFWVNNKIPWVEKVKLKQITTPTLKIKQNNIEKIVEYTDNIDIKDIYYIQRQEYYENFHNILLSDILKLEISVINYCDIDLCIKDILNFIKEE